MIWLLASSLDSEKCFQLLFYGKRLEKLVFQIYREYILFMQLILILILMRTERRIRYDLGALSSDEVIQRGDHLCSQSGGQVDIYIEDNPRGSEDNGTLNRGA